MTTNAELAKQIEGLRLALHTTASLSHDHLATLEYTLKAEHEALAQHIGAVEAQLAASKQDLAQRLIRLGVAISGPPPIEERFDLPRIARVA